METHWTYCWARFKIYQKWLTYLDFRVSKWIVYYQAETLKFKIWSVTRSCFITLWTSVMYSEVLSLTSSLWASQLSTVTNKNVSTENCVCRLRLCGVSGTDSKQMKKNLWGKELISGGVSCLDLDVSRYRNSRKRTLQKAKHFLWIMVITKPSRMPFDSLFLF